MKKQVLFIQGAGEGAFTEDEKLAVSLQDALGTVYQVLYPQMPNEEDPEDEAWIAQTSKELAPVDGNVIFVGHSAGDAVLLKYLLKEHVDQSVAGVFLISIPFWGPEDEEDNTYTLREGFASQLSKECPSSFTIAATMNGCRLHTWQCMQQEFPKQPFVNSTAVGISSITIYLK